MKRWLTPADVVTAVRLPLAAAFPFVAGRPGWQLAIVGAAAVSDYLDGLLARRFGSSRVGELLDPIVDKVFMAAAFLTVALTGRGLLLPIEIAAVLLRDIVAVVGFLGTWALRRPLALAARTAGKAATVCQLSTLAAFIVASPLVRPLAWATAAVGLYAIWDYGRAAAATVGRETREA